MSWSFWSFTSGTGATSTEGYDAGSAGNKHEGPGDTSPGPSAYVRAQPSAGATPTGQETPVPPMPQ